MAFLDVSAMTKDEKAIRAITIPAEAIHWSHCVENKLGPFCFMLDLEELKGLDVKYIQVTVDFNDPIIVKKQKNNNEVMVQYDIPNIRIGQRGQNGNLLVFCSIPKTAD